MNKTTQVYGLYRREVARFLKVPLQAVGAPIVNSLLYLLIFGISLGRAIPTQQSPLLPRLPYSWTYRYVSYPKLL